MRENSTYTLLHHFGECPAWKEKIRITGKYRFSDPERPLHGVFVKAECEIMENLRLPESKRDKRLSVYRLCPQGFACMLLNDFPQETDF